jgi:hypothetical protein
MYVNYKTGTIPYTLIKKFRKILSRFDEKTIGIICTNNKKSKNTINEIEKYNKQKIAISNLSDLIKCIKNCGKIYK